MAIIAAGFDIGQTLIKYNNPLNWSSLYHEALRKVMTDCRLEESGDMMASAVKILSKYNTRENYRKYEVSSDIIFKEIFDAWKPSYEKVTAAKESFYNFFQADAEVFDDTIETLDRLSAKGIAMGFTTDVAYGMDNKYALKDISGIKSYFDLGFTSNDIGFRKPNAKGYQMLTEVMRKRDGGKNIQLEV